MFDKYSCQTSVANMKQDHIKCVKKYFIKLTTLLFYILLLAEQIQWVSSINFSHLCLFLMWQWPPATSSWKVLSLEGLSHVEFSFSRKQQWKQKEHLTIWISLFPKFSLPYLNMSKELTLSHFVMFFRKISVFSKQMTSIFSNLLYCFKAIKYWKHLSFPTRRSYIQSFPTFILHFICIGWRPNSSLFNSALCWSCRLCQAYDQTPPTFSSIITFHSSDQKHGAFFVFLC